MSKVIDRILDRVYFSVTGRCPKCGVNEWFFEDSNGYWHCNNCDWSENNGLVENSVKIEDISVGEGLNHQS